MSSSEGLVSSKVCLLLPSAVAVGECEVENDDSAGLLQTISHEAVKKNNTDATNKIQRTPQAARPVVF